MAMAVLLQTVVLQINKQLVWGQHYDENITKGN